MSYCVHCGVKLADYHETCPLCNTKVLNPNAKINPQTRDFPQYREHLKSKNPDNMKRLFAGTIISFITTIYIIILLLVNYLINGQISWSLIPAVSLVYIWFTVAFPLLRPGQSFFRLYTYDSFATALFLLALNLIISGNIAWSKFAAPGIIFIWIIMSGIFISDRVKKLIPMIIYYILASILFTVLYAFMLTNNNVIVHLVLPIYVSVLVISLLSFFMIKALIFDITSFLAILFANVALLAFVVDMTVSHFLTQSFNPTWSILVLCALIPLSLAGLLMRNIKKLRSFIARKFHR
ncbi:MAG: DUF6320 domain-containing protein [Candidatus Marinimicrobia bacterium]|nr:DUF6320 domain-containing protein [Candidatus Neomarinimicrobiota bacterium]